MAFTNQAVALDKNSNKRFLLKQTAKQMGLSTDDINRALPPTFDEFEAMQENKLLSKNKLPKITIAQNHQVHIEMHTQATDTPAKKLHIEMHKIALYAQRENPALAPQPLVDPATGEAIAPGPGGNEPSPMETGAAPAPRDMAQSPLELQAPNAIQQAA
jgi:hypothetical protein